jgi:hypothetical protein
MSQRKMPQLNPGFCSRFVPFADERCKPSPTQLECD